MHKTILHQAGISLTELMLSLTLGLIVTGLSVPGFTSLMDRNQVTIQAHTILESLYLARSQAISSNTTVHVCKMDTSNGNACSSDRNYNSDWSSGWLIFSDTNRNNDFDPQDALLRVVDMPDKVNIVFNQRGRLRFFPDGTARSAGFYVCDPRQENYRHLYLLYSGRARINQKLTDKQKAICDDL
ncbi:MAG: hypothetical protein HKN85_02655 [Gammaproteobacteria bacterium]|nr:hypothetical protein [Gammaproteobacteria bacterium]